MDIKMINVITLAYLGDAIYEVYIREKMIKEAPLKVEQLQKKAINYVSAKAQAKILSNLIDTNALTDEELDIVKRGRNYKRSSHPKNTDIITYKYATAFEAIIGYFYLTNNKKLDEMMNLIYDEDGR